MTIPWRIGHFVRPVPEGYLETLEDGTCQLASEPLAEYWEALARATRAPLFARGRLGAILRLNLGRYDGLLERHLAELPPPPSAPSGPSAGAPAE